MRTSRFKEISNTAEFSRSLLGWSQQFRELVFLDSNDYPQKYSSFDCLLAADAFTSLKTDLYNAFDDLEQFRKTIGDWLFGYLAYDLKNDLEQLASDNIDGLMFPDLFFFQPKKLFILRGNQLEMSYLKFCDEEIDQDFFEIANFVVPNNAKPAEPEIDCRLNKAEYLERVGKMKARIQRGDIYEANFCMEFFAENAVIDPLEVFSGLNAISEAPFSAFFKNHKQFALCASPERYIRKEAAKIISQPIKGTARRGENLSENTQLAKNLSTSEKERSENIMIVDLVRNDLSHTASNGSVKVEELCGLYEFKQVHHLVSTVTSELKENVSPIEILKTTFPMGSMTGAPKISAMKIIEELEVTKRGLYSGAIGYFTPEGDFDFNVVIRSILYNSERKYVSFSVGSAITSLSDPEKEYEECLVKAHAMRKILSGN